MSADFVYHLLRGHLFQIVCIVLAVVGFALRLRGLRGQSTVFILLAYAVIYLAPRLSELL